MQTIIPTTKPVSDQALLLDQSRLDILVRSRTSRLPWKGQFSPELVEYLMQVSCGKSKYFYDPFCGSGTVLFEATRRGNNAVGVEVNPAAWHLASLSKFSSLSVSEKAHVLKELRTLTGLYASAETFLSRETPDIIRTIEQPDTHPFIRLALAAILLLGMGNGAELSPAKLARACFSVTSLLSEFEHIFLHANCILSDARECSIETDTVDGVITSPPYINVFNYHQNYRPAIELLGWKPLQAASSEIGANRKHRANRFMTVTQYCLDMNLSILEIARVMREGSPLVLVLGRSSTVLGASFRNGNIIRQLLSESGLFAPIRQAERVFTNRYGEQIFEDILISHRLEHTTKAASGAEFARAVGIRSLQEGLRTVPTKKSVTFGRGDRAI